MDGKFLNFEIEEVTIEREDKMVISLILKQKNLPLPTVTSLNGNRGNYHKQW